MVDSSSMGNDVTYLNLADELADELRTTSAGARLPSEHELARRHQVSRITTRAALQELERRHLVRRRRGSGTFAALSIDYPISADMAPSFSETVRRSGHEPGFELHSIRSVRLPVRVRGLLETDQQRGLCVRRTATVDGMLASVSTSWLPGDLRAVKELLPERMSLWVTLTELGLDPQRRWSRAELAPLPLALAGELDVEGRPPTWHLESCNHDRTSGRVVELSDGWLRADVFRVRFELGKPPTPTGGTH